MKRFLVYCLFPLLFAVLLPSCRSAPVSSPSEQSQASPKNNGESATATVTSPSSVQVSEDRSQCEISSPPIELALDPAYEKYCDANGIPIIALGPVSDLAVRQAYYLVINFFAPIPEFREIMITNGAMIAIFGEGQSVRDIPETYTFSLSNAPNVVGLGGSLSQPVTVTHESDLNGRWKPCNRVTIHELGHALRDIVLLTNVRGFLSDSNGTFADAVAQGLWTGSYAGTNADENWAEGLNAYFSSYSDSSGTSYVRDRDDLAAYDPGLFTLIDGIFNGFDWSPTCP